MIDPTPDPVLDTGRSSSLDPVRRLASFAAAATLGAAAIAHVGWAFGSSWPADDREQAASMFAGSDHVPGPAACLSVAGLLAIAATLAAGAGGPHPMARLGRAGVAGTLIVRGLAGITGNTERLGHWRPSDEFKRTDRRLYGPGCLVVGALVAAGSGSGSPTA